MRKTLLLSMGMLASLLLSFNASACDDKPCEAAYLSASERYVENQIRHANAYRVERLAHSKNRERRDYALYVHHHMIHSARTQKNKAAKFMSKSL